MMQITMISDAAAMQQAISDLAKACEEEIASVVDRPTDAFPVKAIAPIFLVNPAHLNAWTARVPREIWNALARLVKRCFVCATDERQLQGEYYALDHDDLKKFREGIPILKIVSAIKPQQVLGVGGRTKHVAEIKIREALEFEVFWRDIEIAALLRGKAQASNTDLMITRGSGLEFLRQNAWIDFVPSKGKARDKSLSKGDRQIALLENLRLEGEMLALKFVPAAVSPSDVENRILGQVERWNAAGRTKAEYEAALASAALPVKILMKACAHVTELAKAKLALAKAIKKAENRAAKRAEKSLQEEKDLASGLQRRRRWRPLDPVADPMSKRWHDYFAGNDFSAFELMFIGFSADVDPNLLSTKHVLATPEFNLARMLRRLFCRQQVRPEFAELSLVHELVFGSSDTSSLYADIRAFLAKAALDLEPRERWSAWFENPIEPLSLRAKK
jgi:hypothetical protein